MTKEKTCAVYISYSHDAEKDTSIKDQLDAGCKAQGLELIHEERRLEIGDSVLGYMHEIGAGNMVITVLSPEYFQSINCMYELRAIHRKGDMDKRVIPVRLNGFDPTNSDEQAKIKAFWNKKLEKQDHQCCVNDDSTETMKKLLLQEIVENIKNMMTAASAPFAIDTKGEIEQKEFTSILGKVRASQDCLPKLINEDSKDKSFRELLHKKLEACFIGEAGNQLRQAIAQELAEHSDDGKVRQNTVAADLCAFCKTPEEDNEHRSQIYLALDHLHAAAEELLSKKKGDANSCEAIINQAHDLFRHLVLYAIRNDWVANNKQGFMKSANLYIEIPLATEGGVEILTARLNGRDARLDAKEGHADVYRNDRIPSEMIEAGWHKETTVNEIITDIWNHLNPSKKKEPSPNNQLDRKELRTLDATLRKPRTTQKNREHYYLILPENQIDHPLNREENRKLLFEKLPHLTLFRLGQEDEAVWFYPEYELMDDIKGFLLMLRSYQ